MLGKSYYDEVNPTQLFVDLDAISRNLSRLRDAGGGRELIVAVKADAYGHGLVAVAKHIESKVAFFGVATVSEALLLREAGIEKPILKLSPTLPDELADAVRARLTLTVSSREDVAAAAAAAQEATTTIPVHLKIDTGMRRVGVLPTEAAGLARQIVDAEGLEFDGVFTHLAVADDEAEQDFTRQQFASFLEAAEAVQCEAGPVKWIHAANSAGILNLDLTGTNAIRPGIAMYGSSPDWNSVGLELEQTARWTSRITLVKRVASGDSVSYGRTWTAKHDTQIATVAVGYGDGYSRRNSNRGRVLIDGRSYPVVGRVCMDQILVDLGPDSDIRAGAEVVLIGASGEQRITPQELADVMETISYEVTCLITGRVPRVY